MVLSESIYNLLLGSPGRITEELKFEVTRGIYVCVIGLQTSKECPNYEAVWAIIYVLL